MRYEHIKIEARRREGAKARRREGAKARLCEGDLRGMSPGTRAAAAAAAAGFLERLDLSLDDGPARGRGGIHDGPSRPVVVIFWWGHQAVVEVLGHSERNERHLMVDARTTHGRVVRSWISLFPVIWGQKHYTRVVDVPDRPEQRDLAVGVDELNREPGECISSPGLRLHNHTNKCRHFSQSDCVEVFFL